MDDRTPRQVAAELRALLRDGAELRPAGEAAQDPGALLRRCAPRYRLQLFDADYYLSSRRYDDNLGFFVAYVGLRQPTIRRVYPRIFYKDSSLVWRVATHRVSTARENWIGKGDVRWFEQDGERLLASAEETTNLPFEIQAALDVASRRGGPARRDAAAVPLVLRRGPEHRIRPYADFSGPRRRGNAARPINGGQPVAWFARAGDPRSLRFAPGFAPDFRRGVLEHADSRSNIYGGAVRKYRILSANRQIQYQFVHTPQHVWVNPPQALSTELSSYGVRTVDALADEDLFIPGFEYHYLDTDEDPPRLHSQIPVGYVGEPSEVDPDRADASPWIERLPVVQRFRRTVLGRAASR